MQEVFFDAVSLSEELSEEEYEQAIFDSLDHSTHFVAIVTDAKELMPGCKPEERDWLQEEMIAFRHELIEHRKNGKFLILVTDSVYQEFNKANKINMDIRWRQYSLIRINEFQDQIMGYLSRKDPEG